MKKIFKRTMLVITALALLLSMGINSLAMELDFTSPTVSEWSNRYWDFSSETGKESPSTITDGGTVTYDNSADDKIASGKGLLVLQRFDAADSGELYWQEYVNGVYGCGDGFIELPITKSTADAAVEIYTNHSGYCVALRWDSDGKLYGKYRETYVEGTATEWKYICDISGLSATFTCYIYTDRDCYNVAVNGKYVACGLYSMTAENDMSQCVRVAYAPGSAGCVYVDYKKCGTISSHVLTPAGVSVDSSNAASGTISVNTDFLGTTAASYPDWNLYTGLFNLSGELVKINVTPVTAANMTANNTNDGYISQTFDINGLNYKELYAKSFVWTANQTPKVEDKICYTNGVPSATSVINATNPLRHSSGTEGSDYGSVEFGDNWMKLTRNADTPDGETAYMAQTCYNNGAQYSLITDSVMTFKLKKSRADMGGFFVGLPCDYATLNWDENGNFWSCYRNSADQDGTTASWTKLGYSIDALEVTVHVAYNGGTSTWSMWIDGVPVVADKYSRAVYNGAHNVPDKIANVRIYTETGKAGDVFELTDFYMYYAVGYGAQN